MRLETNPTELERVRRDHAAAVEELCLAKSAAAGPAANVLAARAELARAKDLERAARRARTKGEHRLRAEYVEAAPDDEPAARREFTAGLTRLGALHQAARRAVGVARARVAATRLAAEPTTRECAVAARNVRRLEYEIRRLEKNRERAA